MIKNNLLTSNSIQKKHLNNNFLKKLYKKYPKINLEVKNEVENSKMTLNVLNKKFKFGFRIIDLRKFQQYKTVAIVGMGGSILGAEAIYNFLEKKIKKKFYFFDDLDDKKLLKIKKNKNLDKILFLVISKSGNTIETLSNSFA